MTFEEKLIDLFEHSDLIYGETRAGRNTNQRVGLLGKKIFEIFESVDEPLSDKFLSKVSLDIAQKLITFLQGAEFGEFIPGMFGGKGARIDADGNMEATSLRLRALLDVPEIRKNKITVMADEFPFTESGMIESVEHIEDSVYQLNMQLEEGEDIEFQAPDLITGIFHTGTGYATSYMIVTEVGQTFMKVTLAAPEDTPTNSNIPPQPFMKLARKGNVTNPERQRYVVVSSRSGGILVYDGCSTFKNGTLVGSLDIAQSFKSLYGDLPLRDGMFYMYAAGLVVQDIVRVNYEGKVIREVTDTGLWQEGRTYYNNDTNGTEDCWHLGCRWRCFTDGTTDTPGWTSQHWIMIEGRSDARMELYGSITGALPERFPELIIQPIVYIGNADVSADIVPEQWRWTRESFDTADDVIWNAQHSNVGRTLNISYLDTGTHWGTNPVKFKCVATYPASSINQISNTIEL